MTGREAIHFLARREQLQKIGEKAFGHGFSTMQDYILWATLESDCTEKEIVAMTTAMKLFIQETNAAMEDVRRNVHENQKVVSAALKESTVKLGKWENSNVLEIGKAFWEMEKAVRVDSHSADVAPKGETGEACSVADLATIIFIVEAALGLAYLFYAFLH